MPNAEPNSPSERINQLETLLAFQQRAYDTLNEVVTEQAARLGRMERRLSRCEDELRQATDHQQGDPRVLDEKPPHY